MKGNGRGGHELDHGAARRRGAKAVNEEAKRRKDAIKEKGLEVGDFVRLDLRLPGETDADVKDPMHGAVCRIKSIDCRNSLELFNKRFGTRRDSRCTRIVDPSMVVLHEKRAK